LKSEIECIGPLPAPCERITDHYPSIKKVQRVDCDYGNAAMYVYYVFSVMQHRKKGEEEDRQTVTFCLIDRSGESTE